MQAAQQLVQRAEHLRREPGGDFGLRVPARLQQRRQTPLGRVVVQPERRQQQLEAAEHRPAADLGQRAEREGQPAAGLAARRIDRGASSSSVIRRPIGDLLLAQQALEPLMRRRLPALERAALVRLHARRLDAHKDLPAAVGIGDRPMRRDLGVALLDLEDRSSGSAGPPGAPATWAARQPSDAAKEGPRVFERARVGLAASVVRLRREERTHRLGVGARLDFAGSSP